MKQTAIDYFYDRMLKLFMQYHEEDVPTINFGEVITEAYEQAKAMEKEQMDKVSEDWWVEGCSYMKDNKRIYESFEQYYTSTFKS